MNAVQQAISKDLLRINQSKIKRLTKTAICPQRYYLEEITGDLERKASEAMDRGHYFEYKIWGTLPKEGHVPILKGGRKKGSISEPQKRIDEQVARFPELMKQYGIKVIKTNYYIEVLYDNEIVFFGTLDSLVEYMGKPYIMDLKLTADVNSTFGDFAWGNFQTKGPNGIYTCEQTIGDTGSEMDIIQAYAYMYMMLLLTRREWGFLYAVFDYKPYKADGTGGPEHKIIEVTHDSECRSRMIERLRDTKYKLKLFHDRNYAPIPSLDECKTCKAVSCTSRMSLDQLEEKAANQQITDMLIASVQQQLKVEDDERPW